MASSDEDFSTSDSDTSAVFFSQEHVEHRQSTSGYASARKKHKSAQIIKKKNKVVLPENLQRISHRLSNITEQLKGTEIDENLSLCIVRTVLELQTFHLQQKVMLSHERRKRMTTSNSRIQVCQLLHISTRIYGRIIHKYLLEHEMYVSSKEQSSQSGNTDSKNIRIP